MKGPVASRRSSLPPARSGARGFEIRLRESERFRDALAVRFVGAQAMGDVAQLDGLWRPAERARGVLEQYLLFRGRHEAKERARLGVVVAVLAVVPVIRRSLDGQRRLAEVGLLGPLPLAVRLVADGAAVISVHPHLPVAVITVKRTARRVHGDL